MTNLVLARHGETVWHAENRYAGRTDVALTPRGHEQAERLAHWAAGADLDGIWSSPLRRALETAAGAGLAAGFEPRIDARLPELDFGRGEGLTVADMRASFPAALDAFHADPVAHHLPGGEDPRAAVRRAVDCLHDIGREHAGRRVLVVAHTTLIRLVLCHLIGVPISHYRRLFPFVHNGAITEIRIDGRNVSLLQFNSPLDPSPGPALVDAAPRVEPLASR